MSVTLQHQRQPCGEGNRGLLGVGRSVLRVVSNLGTVGTLDSDVGSLLCTELLTIGTDPLLGRSLLVDLVELVLLGSGLVGGFGSGSSEDVSSNKSKIAQDLSELGVGDEKSDQDSKVGSG